jgi:hypothetical protein
MLECGLVASIGGPFARPEDIARMAAARTGEAVPIEAAVRSTVAVLMADGTGRIIPTLRYPHPAAQAAHESVYNTAIDQAITRARPQLRTASTSVLSLIFANVQPSQPVTRIRLWRDIPHRLLHMIVRDRVTFNAAAMTALYDAEFPTAKAAEHARRGWGPDYAAFLHNVLQEDPRCWKRIEFQPSGQGHKRQSQYCPAEALAATLAAIKATQAPIGEPTVTLFKAAADDSPSPFFSYYEPEGESSPTPRVMPAVLLADCEPGPAFAPEHPPDG